MPEQRQYYFIKIPNGLAQQAKNVCIGSKCTHKKSIDGTTAYIKTTKNLIDKEVAKGGDIKLILPPGLTEKVTYETTKMRLRSIEFQLKMPE